MADLHPTIETMERRFMRAWVGGDTRELKALTSRNFRLLVGSKPSVILDAKSWVDAATTRYLCKSYQFGDIYVRDLGPMAIASEFPTQVAGQQTRIIETTMFMGRKQRVLATHLGFKDQSASVMIYAVGMDRREFESLLAGVTRTTTNGSTRPR